MYAQICTRPEIAFNVGMLRKYQSSPGEDHWRAAKKVMRYLQRTKDYTLMYRWTDNLEVVGYSDWDFAGVLIHKNQHLDAPLCLMVELYLGEVQSKS